MRALAAASLLFACATSAPTLGGDYARLEGTWVVTYSESFGSPERERIGAEFTFVGDRVKRSADAGDQRFALDESATPKRIDFSDPPNEDILGIYRLDGDELVICTNGAYGVRPTEFRTALYTDGKILTRFTRRKP